MANPSPNSQKLIGRYCFLPHGAPGRVVSLNPASPTEFVLVAEIVNSLRVPVAIAPGSVYVDVNTNQEGHVVFSHESVNNSYSTVEFYGDLFSVAIEDFWVQRQELADRLGARVASNQCCPNHSLYQPFALPEVDETEKWGNEFKEHIGQTLKRVEALETLEVALEFGGKRTPEERANIIRLNQVFDKMNARKKASKRTKGSKVKLEQPGPSLANS